MKLKLVSLLSDENRNEINERKYEDECIGILLLNKFIELIFSILKNLNDYDIVIRIHPAADEQNFLDLLSFNHPRLHIISEGFMSEFINHSEIVIHNSCTGALEAFIAEKPVISFIPKIKIDATEKMNNFPNRIGVKLSDNDEILNFIKKPIRNFNEAEEIKNRIYTDKSSHELIAENINNIEIKSQNSFAKFNYTFKKSYTYLLLKNYLKKISKKYFNHKFTDNSSRYIKFYRDFNFENLSTVLNNIKKKRINSDYDSCEIKMINDSVFEIKKKN